MEVNIAGRSFCHLADYLFNEEQALRAAPWTPLFQSPRRFPLLALPATVLSGVP